MPSCFVVAGSQCSVSCQLDNMDPILKGISKRRSANRRPSRPLPNDIVDILTCTGQLAWYPAPGEIECVDQCSMVSLSLYFVNNHFVSLFQLF